MISDKREEKKEKEEKKKEISVPRQDLEYI
jgi:hypothetical protein